MKQAHEFSGKVQEMNDRLKELRVRGSAAGGMVTVELNGLQEILSCKIDPALIQKGDVELLEDLIVGAVNEAVEDSRRQQAETMKSLSEGIDLGSLGETLTKFMPKQ